MKTTKLGGMNVITKVEAKRQACTRVMNEASKQGIMVAIDIGCTYCPFKKACKTETERIMKAGV